MILLKNNILNLLHAKSNGPYLSCYLDIGDVSRAKAKLKKFIKESSVDLRRDLNDTEITKFLDPVSRVLDDVNLLKQFKRSLGIFRSVDTFQLIDIPITVDDLCVVSHTYHIKPILKWAQTDSEYYFLGVNSHGASLYKGSLHSFRLLDTVFFPEILKKFPDDANMSELKRDKNTFDRLEEAMTWVADWVDDLVNPSILPIYIAGNVNLVNLLKYQIEHLNIVKDQVSAYFNKDKAVDLNLIIRSRIRAHFQERFEVSLVNYYTAEEIGLTRLNIFQIAKDAAEGKIKTLFVAEDFKLWGRFNSQTGQLEVGSAKSTLHNDDVLDDIAQKVIEKGGAVVIGKLLHLPNRRPIAAILHHERANVDLPHLKAM